MDEQQINVGGQPIAFTQSEGAGRAVIFVLGTPPTRRHPVSSPTCSADSSPT